MLTPIIRSDVQMIKVLAFLALMCAALRMIRLRTGTALFFSSLLAALHLVGLETGVSLLDSVVIQVETLQIFLLLLGCDLLIQINKKIYFNHNELSNTVIPRNFLLNIWIPSVASLFSSSSQSKKIVDQTIACSNPSLTHSLNAWYRLWLFSFWPALPLLPILLFLLKQDNAKQLIHELWPFALLWFLSGLILCRQQSFKYSTQQSKNRILLHLTLVFCLLGFSLIYLDRLIYIATLWSLAIASLIIIPEARKNHLKLIRQIDWVRWLMLAAGIASWPWIFNELTIRSGYPLAEALIMRLDHNEILFLTLRLAPLILGFISGSPLMALTLTSPLITELDNPHIILPWITCSFIGAAISPEYHSRLNNNKLSIKKIASSYLNLIIPIFIVIVGLIFLK